MANTFGASVNPAHYAELPTVTVLTSGGDTVVVAPRPTGSGTPALTVRNTLHPETALPDWPIPAGGLLADYVVADDACTLIDISPDAGVTWVGPLQSREAILALGTQTETIQALQTAVEDLHTDVSNLAANPVGVPVIRQAVDGTWPARTTATSNLTAMVFWLQNATGGPPPSTGTGSTLFQLGTDLFVLYSVPAIT